jgi:ABC-type nitrate/sulfonate/bicarbonate transport system substrate-binding protein
MRAKYGDKPAHDNVNQPMFDGVPAMISRLGRLSVAFIVLLCAAAAPGAPARALEDIEMGTIGGPSAVLWPIYIAISQGMFAAENLNIKLTFVPSSAGVQQQLAAGALELSDAGLNDQVRAIFEGAPIALVRLEGQAPPYALLSQPAIKSIAELRGKTLMVGGEKDITRVYIARMLGHAGIKPGDYDLLYSGATIARFAALQSGAVAAAILYPPFNFRAESAGYTNLGLVVDYLKDLPFSGFSVNTAWAAQKKDRVQKFLAAYTRAVAWFNDDSNRAEAIRMMVEVTRQPVEDTEKSYDLFRKIDFFERKGAVSKKKVAEIVEILRSDMRGRPLDINRLFLPDVTQVTE